MRPAALCASRPSTWLSIGAAALVVSGCAHPSDAVIDRAARAELDHVKATTDRQFVYTSCEGGGVAGNCGLIMKWAAKDSFRTRFHDKVCATKSNEECQEAFDRFIDAQLGARYGSADWSLVKRVCDANPRRCDDPVAYELLLVDSQNEAVRRSRVEQEEQIEDRRRWLHAVNRQSLASGLGPAPDVQVLACHVSYDVTTGAPRRCWD